MKTTITTRCRSCNSMLSNREMTRVYERDGHETTDYIGLCDYCFKYVKEDLSSSESELYQSEDYTTDIIELDFEESLIISDYDQLHQN